MLEATRDAYTLHVYGQDQGQVELTCSAGGGLGVAEGECGHGVLGGVRGRRRGGRGRAAGCGLRRSHRTKTTGKVKHRGGKNQ